MQRVKVILTLDIKSDPDDEGMLEADIREELLALSEGAGDLDYRIVEEDNEEEDDEF